MAEKDGAPKLIINARGEERIYGSTPHIENQPLINAHQLAQEIAQAQGLLSPEQYLEDYRDAEDFIKAPFQIVPGAEPRFWPLLNEKERQEWMIRSTLVIAAYKKSMATGADKLYMDEMRELAVDLNKRALKVLFGATDKESAIEKPEYEGVDGVLPATGIYCTIIGDDKFYGLDDKKELFYDSKNNPMKHNLKEVFCGDLSDGDKDRLRADYGNEMVDDYEDTGGDRHKGPLIEMIEGLKKDCPDSIYPHQDIKDKDTRKTKKWNEWGTNISQESFRKLRESIRMWLVTKGRDLLLTTEERNRREDFFNGIIWEKGKIKTLDDRKDLGINTDSPQWKDATEEDKKGYRKLATKQFVFGLLQGRARDAEQIAWNFVYSTSILENFDSRAYRPEGTRRHNPSNFWALFQWVAMHPQERFEQKIARGTEAKEEWSALGTWGVRNLSKRRFDVRRPDGSVGAKIPEELRVLPDAFIRSPLHPSMHEGAVRDDSETIYKNEKKEKGSFFETFNQVGNDVLFKTDSVRREELEGRIKWEEIKDSPFVPFIYDEMRWADVVINVFKKGGEASRIGLADLGEAVRNLRLSHETRERLLMIYSGIDPNSKKLKPKEPWLDWKLRMVALKEYFPNFFLEK